ncbi:MAG: hypothetical protein JST28_23725 [Acidobacteria bacterium]|nr:hypothetical protein [Acidobacteriota bacterium]
MKITIDGQDYTFALDAAHPLTIKRKLNEPSVCRLWITTPARERVALARNQALRIAGDDGSCYFTGYVAATPMPEYAGLGVEGPRYRMSVEAVSDECLLDQAGAAPWKASPAMAAGTAIAALVAKTGMIALSTSELSLEAPVSAESAQNSSAFTVAAASIASQARAAYRAMNGVVELTAMPSVVHWLNEADGSLSLENLTLTAGARRALANDITVCGEREPTSYVTEYFLGDGVTTQFYLSDRVFAPTTDKSTLIRELFNEGHIDQRVWGNSGRPGYLTLGAGGLTMQGGNGRDGETLLGWLDPVEMGGTLLLEATGVTLANGSSGVLAGFFTGDNLQSACTAGFKVTAEQGTGDVSIQPLVLGVTAGASYMVSPSKQYALRARVHCPEVYRSTSIYRTIDDFGAVATGGELIAAPANLQLEIQEFVNGVAGMPVTLFEGTIANLPASCTVVAASSINLDGSMRAFHLTNLGSGWVSATPSNGSPVTRRTGYSTQAAECLVESSGRVVFYPGFAPAMGEQIAVSYRTVGRAIGRNVNAESQQQLAASCLPPVSVWVGSVTNPPSRCSQDCRNAASALVNAAASVTALWSGTYKCMSGDLNSDVWPGDALAFNAPPTGVTAQMIVRNVKLTYHASLPDVVCYEIEFANDWAEDLAIKTSSEVPADAWLPTPAGTTNLANLSGLTVTNVSGQSVTINAGTTAPAGGGFEVRRRDNCFLPGSDADLVMRTSQPIMTLSRFAAGDRFYIRAFDGSNPPNYSEFSAALIFNLPLAV